MQGILEVKVGRACGDRATASRLIMPGPLARARNECEDDKTVDCKVMINPSG